MLKKIFLIFQMKQICLVTYKLHSPKTNHALHILESKMEKRGTIHMFALDFFILAYK